MTRFLLFKPESLMEHAFCANAGWYTVPNPDILFPYGTKNSPTTVSIGNQAFAKKLTVLLGKLDTNPNSAGLRHNIQADAQGLYRLARGRHFYAESQRIASNRNTEFNWRLTEVEGIGHNQNLMAINALPLVLQTAVHIAAQKDAEMHISYSSEGVKINGLGASEKFVFNVFNTEGKAVWTTSGYCQKDQFILWQPTKSGIYFMQVIPTNSKAKTLKIMINKKS